MAGVGVLRRSESMSALVSQWVSIVDEAVNIVVSQWFPVQRRS